MLICIKQEYQGNALELETQLARVR